MLPFGTDVTTNNGRTTPRVMDVAIPAIHMLAGGRRPVSPGSRAPSWLRRLLGTGDEESWAGNSAEVRLKVPVIGRPALMSYRSTYEIAVPKAVAVRGFGTRLPGGRLGRPADPPGQALGAASWLAEYLRAGETELPRAWPSERQASEEGW